MCTIRLYRRSSRVVCSRFCHLWSQKISQHLFRGGPFRTMYWSHMRYCTHWKHLKLRNIAQWRSWPIWARRTSDLNGSSSSQSWRDWVSTRSGSDWSCNASRQLLTLTSSTVHLEEESDRVGESAKETHFLPTYSYYVVKFSRDYVTVPKKRVLFKEYGFREAAHTSIISYLRTTLCSS